ncbi:MAG: hypothetical protein ACD_20C00056G0009 [uncultured bacterium]|nr:MAG: hypothetical protein ACD_20C00056G0009 [uncultured bacterium]
MKLNKILFLNSQVYQNNSKQNYDADKRQICSFSFNYMGNSFAKDKFVKQNISFGSSVIKNNIGEELSVINVIPDELPSLQSSVQKVKDLSGEWEYFLGDELPQKEKSPIGKMNLPSNWFLMGEKNFPEEFKVTNTKPFNANNPKIKPDIKKGLNYSGTVIYRKIIDLKEDANPNKPHFLDLDMVDYYGQVYLNGKPAGNQHEGYFQQWSVNLTEVKNENGQQVLKKGKNEILIKVSDPALPFDDTNMLNGQILNKDEDINENNKQKFPASFPKRQNKVKGVLGFHDCRPGSVHQRGQECSTGGIIRGIKLRQSPGIDIISTKIIPVFDSKKVSKNNAEIIMQFVVTNFTDKPKEIVLNCEISPHNFKEKGKTKEEQVQVFSTTVTIPPHEIKSIEHIEQVKNPKLWSTWDKGYPHLYQANIKVEEKGNKDKILDQKLKVFGIKTITRDENNTHYLNGEKFYPRGINYISTQYLSQADKNWYQGDIDLIKEANLNTVLVHAHVERPEFYDLCDREGIAVIQGFPLIWTYTEDPSFEEKAKIQAKDMVDLLGNHSSIIEWIAHNEGTRNPELYKKITESIKSKDNLSRPIIKNAGEKVIDKDGNERKGPETENWHAYPEWYKSSTPEYTIDDQLSEHPFVDEFGAQALSNKPTLQKIFNKKALNIPKTQAGWKKWKHAFNWVYANFQPKQMFEIAGVNPGKNIDEFIVNSQKNQAKLLQYEIEYLRRHKWDKEKPNTGEVVFLFADPWRAASSWAVVDYDRKIKPGYEAIKKANQPLLPSIKYEWKKPDSPVEIVLVNDKKEEFKDLIVKYQIGNEKMKFQKIEKLEADSVKSVVKLGILPSVIIGETPLKVWVENSKGKIISKNSIIS